MEQMKDLDVVALTESFLATHYETGKPITLQRGQVGTVVMTFDGTVFEVEFSHKGAAFAIETIPAEKLLLLRHELAEARM